jgi:hypothetical protein
VTSPFDSINKIKVIANYITVRLYYLIKWKTGRVSVILFRDWLLKFAYNVGYTTARL